MRREGASNSFASKKAGSAAQILPFGLIDAEHDGPSMGARNFPSGAGTFLVQPTLQDVSSSPKLFRGVQAEAPATMTTDESLMLEFKRGSRDAFDELYARYCGPLYGFFRRRVENHGRAEDLAQETFLVVIRNAVRYEPRSLVRTYLYGIALKLLVAERRKHSRDALPEEAAAEPAANDTSDAALWVQQAIAKLSDTEREILMLREYEQLSYSEIAEILRPPVNTVRSRLFRARVALKEMLEPKGTLHQPESKNDSRASSAATASDSGIKGKV